MPPVKQVIRPITVLGHCKNKGKKDRMKKRERRKEEKGKNIKEDRKKKREREKNKKAKY